jgi:hypothetical protein
MSNTGKEHRRPIKAGVHCAPKPRGEHHAGREMNRVLGRSVTVPCACCGDPVPAPFALTGQKKDVFCSECVAWGINEVATEGISGGAE